MQTENEARLDEHDFLQFVKATETMISPKDVGGLYKRAEMLAKLPRGIQEKIITSAGGDDPYIGFVVEPYAYFLSYEITDVEAAQALLPSDYRLVPTAIFEHNEPRYAAIVAAFNLHTSVFWGSRVELYVIAEHTGTGMLSWVIVDYESNTINYDPGEGFSPATTSHSVVTTTHAGGVVVDVKGAGHLASTADMNTATRERLDQRLWIEGNLSVDYGGRLMAEGSDPFGLIFDPAEMASALELPLESVEVTANTFGDSYRAAEPFEAAVFPFAQHFLTTSYPVATRIRDGADLVESVREFNGG